MGRYSHELLLQARMLATREPQRPKQASLRRSISASYYALFHFLAEEITRQIVGAGHDQTHLRHFAARAFVHGKMKEVCQEFAKTTPSSKLLKHWWNLLPVATSPEVKTVAESFIELQNLRHAADYNFASSLAKQEAINAANRAQEAMTAWRQLQSKQPRIANLFGLSLVLWPGLSGH